MMVGLILVSLWDTVTTIYGTMLIVGRGAPQVVISVLFGILISVFLLRTIPILKNPREDLLTLGTKALWFLALLYDLYTAFEGNMDLILGENASGHQKVIIAVGLTIFICSAPIGLSRYWFDDIE